uniref:PUM-HD domain-containing protein n=1 Tax=Leersia perrieri TaxID=77586 RepID=A0A0D9VQK8_9ORYZ
MMMRAAVTAAAEEREREMELLLDEIPHVTAPNVHGGAAAQAYAAQCNGFHGGHGHGPARHNHAYAGLDPYSPVVQRRRDDGGGRAIHVAPRHSGGFVASPASSTSAGSAPSPGSSNPSPPLVRAVADTERLANQLDGLRVGDAPAPAALMPLGSPAPADVGSFVPLSDVSAAAHGAYNGYNFVGAQGFPVHHDPVLADQAMAAGYVATSQRFPLGVGGLDIYGGFPTNLDTTSAGSFMYTRTRNGSGIGWGQGLVHPDHARPVLFSGQSGAEYNWGYASTGQSPLDARGRNFVPARDIGYMEGVFSQVEPFHRDDSMIFDRKKSVPFLNRAKERGFQQYASNRPVELESPRMLRYENMLGVKNYIYFMAIEQNGCRSLQQRFEEGKDQVDEIFEGIIGHIHELMENSFANYLVQKLLDVCDEDQRLRIIAVLTEDPMKLLRVSRNSYGTRAVQKLIETVKTRKQIVLIISALRPTFIHLVNDQNGNHVIQKCLKNFGAEENKFIFEAAAIHCCQMAINRHGCCVLQSCISKAYGEYLVKLIVQICANGLSLAQDQFGNYVIQCVLDLKFPFANTRLASQFARNYVCLSKQKVGSNVVERCLKVFPDDDKAAIIWELISASHFEQLLQDPYANYVIHTALVETKGHLRNALVDAILPHEEAIRTNPCCKRISKALSRRQGVQSVYQHG